MDELIALVRVVSRQRVKKIDLFGENVDIPLKSRMLYDNIRDGKIKSDHDALALIYSNSDKKTALRKLKARLSNRLINTLFFIDYDRLNFSSYQQALYQVSKNWVAIKILLDRIERSTAINIAEKTYSLAKRHEMTEFSLLLGRELYRHYAYLQPNKRKYERIGRELDELKQVFDSEMLSEKHYCKISRYDARSKGDFGKEKMAQFKSICEELREMQKTNRSYKFNLETYQLLSFYYLKLKDFDEALKISKEALMFFMNKPFDDRMSIFMIQNDIIASSIQLKEYSTAENYLLENLKLVTPNSFAWFREMNFYFVLLSMKGKYLEMFKITSEVTHSSQFKSYLVHHQTWLIKEAYIHFLIRMGKIETTQTEKFPLRPFRLNRFLNEVPIYSKDKRGLNISILIIQMLFLIEQKKYNKVIDRLDALKQYKYRYLRNDSSFRSNCFVKMLLKIADLNFHPVRVNAHTDILFKKLSNSPMELSDQSSEVEVIPFENLWAIVIELLEKNKT